MCVEFGLCKFIRAGDKKSEPLFTEILKNVIDATPPLNCSNVKKLKRTNKNPAILYLYSAIPFQ